MGLAQRGRPRGAGVPVQTDCSQRMGSSPPRRGRASFPPHLSTWRRRGLGAWARWSREGTLVPDAAVPEGWAPAGAPGAQQPGERRGSGRWSGCVSGDLASFHWHLMAGDGGVLPGQRSWEGWALLVSIPWAPAKARGRGTWVLATDPPSFLHVCVCVCVYSADKHQRTGLPHLAL